VNSGAICFSAVSDSKRRSRYDCKRGTENKNVASEKYFAGESGGKLPPNIRRCSAVFSSVSHCPWFAFFL
jgi:hypothetical protein